MRKNWKDEHFIEDIRGTITFLTHPENVLTAEALLLLLDLHEKVKAVQFEGGNYTQACMKIPITNILLGDKRRRRKRVAVEIEATSIRPADAYDSHLNESYEDNYHFNFYGTGDTEEYEDFDGADDENLEGLPKDIYCDIVETLQDKCGEYSLLEIWKYDKKIIANLNDQDIINAINQVDESPIFGYKTNYTSYLGQVEYNRTGHVVNAKSIRNIWLEQFNPDDIPPKTGKIGSVDVEQVDPFTLGYELEVLKVLKAWKNERDEENNGYSLYMNLGLSYSSEVNKPIQHDVKKQLFGYTLMFLYTLFNLGKLNMVEGKFYLAAAGIFSVFLGVLVGVSLTVALGFPFTPASVMLPFICLGIGIDDIFVIMRCFNNIPAEKRKANTAVTNIGMTIKQAGASITVTSATNICGFATGAMTSFPGLQSFCICAAFAIAAIYLFQISWFVAWMVLDEQRIEQRRNGIVPFIIHKDWEPQVWTQVDITAKAMSSASRLFKSVLFQAFIIVLAMVIFSIGVFGICEIKFGHLGVKLVPKDSYFRAWIDQNKIDFPSDGYGVNFFTQGISYTIEDFEKIEMMVNELDNLTRTHNEWVHYGKELPKSVQTVWEAATGFWWVDLKMFIAHHKDIKDWREVFDNGRFPMYLSDFLHHEDGSIYTHNFRFSGNLTCNMDAPPIAAAKLGSLKFRDLEGLDEIIPAQHAVNDILSKANLSERVISDSLIYFAWEVIEILANEMFSTLAITIAAVFFIILFTLQNIRGCFFTLACVLLTLVDIVGAMHLCGIIIEPLAMCTLLISIGLSVDYGAHVAHAFIISKGTRKERAIDGFISIGPAVLHGGISTFLALTPLALSQSYVFISFFKMTSFTILFGLFHGLFFLPVMLSIFGDDNIESPASIGENILQHKDSVLVLQGNNNKVSSKDLHGADNPSFINPSFINPSFTRDHLA